MLTSAIVQLFDDVATTGTGQSHRVCKTFLQDACCGNGDQVDAHAADSDTLPAGLFECQALGCEVRLVRILAVPRYHKLPTN
jgi:hypothetical protein